MEQRQRKVLGSYYTPAALAQWMVDNALREWASSANQPSCGADAGHVRGAISEGARRPTCLDPACGDGVFVEAVCHWLAAHVDVTSERGATAAALAQRRIELVRHAVHGVDVDANAVTLCRSRLRDFLLHGQTAELAGDPTTLGHDVETDRSGLGEQYEALWQAADDVVNRQIVHGEALVGPAFSESGDPEDNRDVNGFEQRPGAADDERTNASLSEPVNLDVEAIDWTRTFPEIARAGGFDLVVGNPPYRRERDFKQPFARAVASPLGARWREARMDFWFLFLHRGLDLLKPAGCLSYVVNSYWMHSAGARRMRQRLQDETHVSELVLFDGARLFAGVSGRHMVFRIHKADVIAGTPRAGGAMEPLDTPGAAHEAPPCRIVRLKPGLKVYTALQSFPVAPAASNPDWTVAHVPQVDLFTQSGIAVAPRSSQLAVGMPLGKMFEVRQGIAENPPRISTKQHDQFPELIVGEGVFVLTSGEVKRLGLSDHERSLLRPYFATNEIGRYRAPRHASRWLIYSTKVTLPTLDGVPVLARHFARFRCVLEQRRETRRGVNRWWHLHWPREERLFLGEKVVSVQMGREPQFAYVPDPAFVGFSSTVVVPIALSPLPLAALVGMLNSQLARLWFEQHAKRRGVNLEINSHVLERFPLPTRFDPQLLSELNLLVRQRQDDAGDFASPRLEAEIEQRVNDLYGAK